MRALRAILAVAASAAAGACAQGAADPPAPPGGAPAAVTRVDTVRVETTTLEERVARLQIQVLERDVQLRELQDELEATRLELVRTMARLQTQASRAEAASSMAEAEIALGTLRRAPGGPSLPELQRAEALFQQSSREFASENYGGALYLAAQVRGIVRGGQARLRGSGGQLRPGEALFQVPLPLRTTSRSNVRSGPGLSYDVLFTLDAAELVVGQSYTSLWVRVSDDGGREGWIFHNLVTSR